MLTTTCMTREEKLQRWSESHVVGRVVASNYQAERFLNGSDKERLLDAIDSVAPPVSGHQFDVAKCAEAYQNCCYTMGRRGGLAPKDILGGVLGRAVEFKTFVTAMKNAFPSFFIDDSDAENFVLKLAVGANLTPAEKRLTMCSPKRSAWATWDHDDCRLDPFGFAAGDSERVRACMGLDPLHRDNFGLLLLVFALPNGVNAFRPTIADAALYAYFAPPSLPEVEHGWTRPWLPNQSKVESQYLKPRPEIVHEAIEFSTLVRTEIL